MVVLFFTELIALWCCEMWLLISWLFLSLLLTNCFLLSSVSKAIEKLSPKVVDIFWGKVTEAL